MKRRIAVAVCAFLMGCSSGTSTEPPPDDGSGQLFQYDAIEGTWSGWDYTGDFAFAVNIAGEAHEGEQAGTIDVLRPSDGRLVSYCGTPMEPISANPPVYVFDTSAGTCSPTSVTFVHDPVDDRIEVSNSNGEAGYLIRGTDPGPPPQ